MSFTGFSDVVVEIVNCQNYGDLNSVSTNYYTGIGGIAGSSYTGKSIVINSCYNEGTITNGTKTTCGGIIGFGGYAVYNSYNIGTIKGSGIAGYQSPNIYNCYNMGECSNSGIAGGFYLQSIIIKNVYTTSNVGNKPILVNTTWTYDITNAFYSSECSYTDSYGTSISEENMKGDENDAESLISQLNEYVETYNEENAESDDFIALNYWRIDEVSGYPIFE